MKQGKALTALLLAALLGLGSVPGAHAAVFAAQSEAARVAEASAEPEETALVSEQPDGSDREPEPEGSMEEPEASQLDREPEDFTEEPEASQLDRESEDSTEEPEASQLDRESEESTEEPEASQLDRESEDFTEEPEASQLDRESEDSTEEPEASHLDRESEESTEEPEVEAEQSEAEQRTPELTAQDEAQDGAAEQVEEDEEEDEEAPEQPTDPSTDPNYFSPVVALLTGRENAYQNYKLLRRAIKRADGVHHLTIKVAKPGRYYVSYKDSSEPKSLRLRTMTTLDLNGATLIRTGNTANLVQVETLDGQRSVAGYTAAKDLVIKNGTLDGGEGEAVNIGANLVNLGHIDGLTIQNVRFTHGQGSHLLELNGCRNCLITNCSFHGFEAWLDDYAKACPEAVQLDIAYNGAKTSWNGVYCLEGTPGNDKTVCRNITISHCQFKDFPSGVGNHHALYGGPKITGVTITHNRFTNSKRYAYLGNAIWCYGFRDCVVSDNVITGRYAVGVRVSASQVKVKDNTIGTKSRPFSGYAVYLDGANCNVPGSLTARKREYVSKSRVYRNKLYTSLSGKEKGAVNVLGKSRLLTVSGNTIHAPKASGIVVKGGSKVDKLSKNQVKKAGRSGIVISGSKTGHLESNTLSSSGSDGGLRVVKKSSVTKVSKNTIRGAKGAGVSVTSGSRVQELSGNQILSPTGNGIYLGQCSVTRLNSNKIQKSKKNGLLASESAVLRQVKGNTVSGCRGTGLLIANPRITVTVQGNRLSGNTAGLKVLSKGKVQGR